MKKIFVVVAAVLMVSSAMALSAQIDQQSPSDVFLDSENNYTFTAEYSSSSSTGDIKSREWNMLSSSQTDSGVDAGFDFDRSSSSSNTIRLTVSNGSDTDVDEVTQVIRDRPNASLNLPSDVQEGDTAELSANYTNSFDSPVTFNWTIGGTNLGEEGRSLSHTFDSSGSVSVTLTVEDDAGYNSTVNKNIQVATTEDEGTNDTEDSPSPEGSPSGPAAPVNPDENQTGDENKTSEKKGGSGVASKSRRKIIAESRNGVARVNITKGEGVNEINVQVDPASDKAGVKNIRISSNRSGQVSVSVKDMGREKPEQVPDAAEEVYNYQEINTSIDDSEIDVAEVDFSVNKTWLEERNRSVDDVVMKRYDGSWESLPTTHLNSTEELHNFEARSEGFSYYSVALSEEETEKTTTEESGDITLYIAVAAGILVLIAIIYLLRRRSKQNEFDSEF